MRYSLALGMNSAVSFVAAIGCGAVPAQADETSKSAQQPEPEKPGPDVPIIVIGNRTTTSSTGSSKAEIVYDADRIASQSVGTVGELLEGIAAENGDTDSVVLVNGQIVSSTNDIADLPVEAVSRVEVLPRGAATSSGGAPGQRVFNVILKPSVKSATVTASRQIATEGHWGNTKGEIQLTYVKQQDRVNLTFRGAGSDALRESDRAIEPLAEPIAYAALGNILPLFGSEIDPALSLLAGQSVSSLALPQGATTPTLATLVAGANQLNPSNLAYYRTLRGSSHPYDISLAGNKKLTPWLALMFNGRLNWSKSNSLSGLPSARFVVPTTNVHSPFSRTVLLALNDPSRPLHSNNSARGQNLSLTLNANFGPWIASLNGRYEARSRDYTIDRIAPISGGFLTVEANANPFDGRLAGLIPVTQRTTHTKAITREVGANIEGPLFTLPAGDVRGQAGVRLARALLNANGTTPADDRAFRRRDFTAIAGLSIPLTSAQGNFLPRLGESSIALEFGRLDMGQYGLIKDHSVILSWTPVSRLRLSASEIQKGRAIAPELIALPTLISENVRYFDPLNNETVNITTISGGSANLRNESQRLRRLSLSADLLPKYKMRINLDYLDTRYSNQLGALPAPSTAVVAAFPDRFVRDAAGRLTLVDNRTVNLDSQHARELRSAVEFTIPLSGTITATPVAATPGKPRPVRRQPWTVRVNAAHTYLLENTTVIRAGLGSINMLDGGAIGIGGGRQRHAVDGSVVVSQGGTGARLNLAWRGSSYLRVGSIISPDRLTFEPTTKLDLTLFADVGTWFPKSKLLRGWRMTVSAENLLNKRQQVYNTQRITPLGYQPGYRDPIGRTVLFELRKSL